MVEIKEVFVEFPVMHILDDDIRKILNSVVVKGAYVKIRLANIMFVALNQVLKAGELFTQGDIFYQQVFSGEEDNAFELALGKYFYWPKNVFKNDKGGGAKRSP